VTARMAANVLNYKMDILLVIVILALQVRKSNPFRKIILFSSIYKNSKEKNVRENLFSCSHLIVI
jgi:hypothetical protein